MRRLRFGARPAIGRLAFLTLLALPAAAWAMPVSTFLAKADALMKKGPMAVFSGDIGLLKGEMKASFAQLRAEQTAARKAGRRPDTCMPAKVGVRPDELLGYLRAIPIAQRGMPMKDALGTWMQKKHPCPA